MTKELISKLRELSDRVFHGDTKPGDFRIIDRAADALAAVPDAATGNVQKMYDRACADIQEYSETIKRLEAERDAALAAIERIRQAVSGHPECDRYEDGDVISCGWKSAYASVVAALDGAPEPVGTEWVYRARNSILNSGTHVSEEAARATLQLMIENHSFEVEPEPVFIERRPRFAWLPVEGESKP